MEEIIHAHFFPIHENSCLHCRWVEEDPQEILQSVLLCVQKAVENLKALHLSVSDIKCKARVTSTYWLVLYLSIWYLPSQVIEVVWVQRKQYVVTIISDEFVCFISGIGITNQRETTVVWDKTTGKPLYNAIGIQ